MLCKATTKSFDLQYAKITSKGIDYNYKVLDTSTFGEVRIVWDEDIHIHADADFTTKLHSILDDCIRSVITEMSLSAIANRVNELLQQTYHQGYILNNIPSSMRPGGTIKLCADSMFDQY